MQNRINAFQGSFFSLSLLSPNIKIQIPFVVPIRFL